MRTKRESQANSKAADARLDLHDSCIRVNIGAFARIFVIRPDAEGWRQIGHGLKG
jgi:hypothetical protein